MHRICLLYLTIGVLFGVVMLSGCGSADTVKMDPSLSLDSICTARGGEWNECSSACLGTEDTICAAVCIPACECIQENDFACPQYFICQRTQTGVRGRCIQENA